MRQLLSDLYRKKSGCFFIMYDNTFRTVRLISMSVHTSSETGLFGEERTISQISKSDLQTANAEMSYSSNVSIIFGTCVEMADKSRWVNVRSPVRFLINSKRRIRPSMFESKI